MASYQPPTEDLPIFDDSVFNAGDIPLTYSKALKYFLAYPNAQGLENLQEIVVNGTATFNNSIIANGTANVVGTLTANVSNFNNTVTLNGTVTSNGTMGIYNQPLTIWGNGLVLRDIVLNTNAIIRNISGFTTIGSPAANQITFSPSGTSQRVTMTGTDLLNNYTMPAIGDSSTKVPTTAWVTSSIAAIPAPTTMLVTNSAAGVIYSVGITTSTTGVKSLFTSGTITYNYSAGTVTATTFQGALSGNATSATSANSILTVSSMTNTIYLVGGLLNSTTVQQMYPTQGLTYYNYQGLLTTPQLTTTFANVTGTQLAVTDNSTSVATTAWVQSVVTPVKNVLWQQPAPYAANGGFGRNFVNITGIPDSYFLQVTGVIPPSFKFHISFTTASTDYANIFSYFADLDVYPSRMTNINPPTSGSPQSAGGGVAGGYNANNAINGNTTYGVIDPIYAPYGRWYWSSNPVQGLESGGASTFLFYNCLWQNISPNNTTLTVRFYLPTTTSSPSTLNPSSGFPFAVNAQINYNINYLGSNIILNSGGAVLLS